MSRTPLHLAALTANTDIYRRLLELGIDSRSLDQKGKTAEYYLKNNPVVSTNEVQELSQLASTNASSLSSSQTRLNRIGPKKGKPTRLRPLVPRKTPETGEQSSKPDVAEADGLERPASTPTTPPSTPQHSTGATIQQDQSEIQPTNENLDQASEQFISDRGSLDVGDTDKPNLNSEQAPLEYELMDADNDQK